MAILKVKVSNMRSARGNDVPNQFEIQTPKGRFFQSYYSTIVFIDNKGNVYLDKDKWDYSKTTGNYRNQFLGDYGIQETREKIKSGEYKLKNLNQ